MTRADVIKWVHAHEASSHEDVVDALVQLLADERELVLTRAAHFADGCERDSRDFQALGIRRFIQSERAGRVEVHDDDGDPAQ